MKLPQPPPTPPHHDPHPPPLCSTCMTVTEKVFAMLVSPCFFPLQMMRCCNSFPGHKQEHWREKRQGGVHSRYERIWRSLGHWITDALTTKRVTNRNNWGAMSRESGGRKWGYKTIMPHMCAPLTSFKSHMYMFLEHSTLILWSSTGLFDFFSNCALILWNRNNDKKARSF